jgi:hypothetical protein
LKVKWEALRAYTLDLIDGPVLSMNTWSQPSDDRVKGDFSEATGRFSFNLQRKDRGPPTRERLLLWMERIKDGVDTIKITFGPEWMYIWKMNEYGRALNARMYLEKFVQKHVVKGISEVPVVHAPGHAYHEPSTQPIPLLTWRDNMRRDHEGIFGSQAKPKSSATVGSNSSRQRSNSMPFSVGSDAKEENVDWMAVEAERTKQDSLRNRSGQIGSKPQKQERSMSASVAVSSISPVERQEARSISLPVPETIYPHMSTDSDITAKGCSVLKAILSATDEEGNGVTEIVATEICLALWLMMDVGNAWTSMALSLLAFDSEACGLIQEELDILEMEFGSSELFSPAILGKMVFLDALLYEAIRLTPAFLGGMKETTETVEFLDIGVQIAKGTHVIFCQATDQEFDIHKAVGKKPERIGQLYPCAEL